MSIMQVNQISQNVFSAVNTRHGRQTSIDKLLFIASDDARRDGAKRIGMTHLASSLYKVHAGYAINFPTILDKLKVKDKFEDIILPSRKVDKQLYRFPVRTTRFVDEVLSSSGDTKEVMKNFFDVLYSNWNEHEMRNLNIVFSSVDHRTVLDTIQETVAPQAQTYSKGIVPKPNHNLLGWETIEMHEGLAWGE